MRQRQQQQEGLSRLLSYMLGRRPDEFGLVPDAEGWVAVKEVVRVLVQEKAYAFVRMSHLEELAHLVQSPRIELAEGRVRARERGELPQAQPVTDRLPALLYHAITAKSHPAAVRHGLHPGPSGWLTLTDTPEMARRIGERRDPKAVLATVQAQVVMRAGITFFRYGERLYLTRDPIGPEFVRLPPLPQETPARKGGKEEKPQAPAPPTPGSVLLDILGQPVRPWKQKDKKREPGWKEQVRKERRRRGK